MSGTEGIDYADQLKEKILEKYSGLDKVDPNRILIKPAIPETIKEFMSYISSSHETIIPSYMFSQLRLLDTDDIIQSIATTLPTGFNTSHKCLLSLITSDDRFDGTYSTESNSFTGTFKIPKYFEGMFDIQIVTSQQLNSVTLQVNLYGDDGITIDNGSLVQTDGDKYTYSFLRFKDLNCVLPNLMCNYYMIKIDPTIEAVVKIKHICLDTEMRSQIAIKSTPILPIMHSNNQQWLAFPPFFSIYIDLSTNTYKQLGSMNDPAQSISEFINNGKRQKREENIRNVAGPCIITKIAKATKSSFGESIALQLYMENLSLTQLVTKYPNYTIDDNHFVQLDGVDVSYEHFNHHSPDMEISFGDYGHSIGIIQGVDPINLTNILYPLYVLSIVCGTNEFIINLLDGTKITFSKDNKIYNVTYYDNDESSTLYEFEFSSELEKFKDEFEGPYESIGFRCKMDCEHPDLDWFMNEDNKRYVYWNGMEYQTMPPCLEYLVPTQYKDMAVNILESNGYIIHD